MDISETEDAPDVLPENLPEAVPNDTEIAGAGQIAEEIEAAHSDGPPPVAAAETPDLPAVLADLTRQLSETNRISQERELVIDRLHQENQRLKQGELQQALLPVFRDLIRFYDDLGATALKYAEQASDNETVIVRDLNSYAETVGDILYRYGVERIPAGSGDDFNPKEHKAVAVAPTDSAEQDRKISKIIRDGFRTETKIVRNVEVEIYRYRAPSSAKDEAHSQESAAEQEGGGAVSQAFENDSEVE